MENLQGLMRIHGGSDLGNNAQVSVDEFTQSAVVIHCAFPTATSYIQFETGNAERVLHVHQQQPDFGSGSGSRLKPVSKRPLFCIPGPIFVCYAPDLIQSARVKKNGYRQNVTHQISITNLFDKKNGCPTCSTQIFTMQIISIKQDRPRIHLDPEPASAKLDILSFIVVLHP